MSIISRFRKNLGEWIAGNSSFVGSGTSWSSTRLTTGFGASLTGKAVTASTVLAIPAVYAAMRLVARDVGKLTLNLQRTASASGGWIVDRKHRHNAIIRRPNAWPMSFGDVSSTMAAGYQLRGNGFAFVTRDAEYEATGIVPLGPDDVQLDIDSTSGEVLYRIQHPLVTGGTQRRVRPIDVLHPRNINVGGGLMGISPIAACAEALGAALATQEHTSRMFGQAPMVRGFITTSGDLTDEEADAFGKQFGAAYGGVQNSAQIPFFSGPDFQFVSMDINAKDAQWLETRTFTVLEVARMMGVPPHKLAHLADAHYDNIEAENDAYVVDTLLPILTQIENELARCLLSDEERQVYRFKFDTDALTRADIKTRFDVYRTATEIGIFNVNECRAREGLPPRTGGDEYRVSVQTQDANGNGVPDHLESSKTETDE